MDRAECHDQVSGAEAILEYRVQLWYLQYKREHRHTGESPAKGHKDDLGLEAPVRWREESERAVTPQLGEKKAQGDLINVRKWRRGEVHCSHWCLLAGREAMSTN